MLCAAPVNIATKDTARHRAVHPVRRLLWKAAIPMTAFLLMMIVSDTTARLRDPSPRLSLGHDFLPSYSAGVLVRQGNPRGMYDRNALSAVEFQVIHDANLEISGRYGPWLNPPFFAWAFAPLSVLPYRQAATLFLVFNIVLLGITLALLTRLLLAPPGVEAASLNSSAIDWRTLALVPLLTILPLPVWQAMGHQQNTFISLFLLTLAVMCWRQNKAFIAGIIAGLLFFKPQLAAVFALVLVIGMGWRAVAGLTVTGVALLAITLITMPGCLYDFLHRLPPILHWQQVESPYNWGRQVTFHSFWRLLIQGQVRAETAALAKLLWWISSGAIAAGMLRAVWLFRTGSRSAIVRDRLIAAAIISMPMLMPYYMDYDLLLLAIPAVLLAGEWIRQPAGITRADRWLLVTWIAFGVESHINPGVAGSSRFNLIVPLLATLSALYIWRCVRRETQTVAVRSEFFTPLSKAA